MKSTRYLKLFVIFLITAVLAYSLSAHIAYAGGTTTLLGWITTIISGLALFAGVPFPPIGVGAFGFCLAGIDSPWYTNCGSHSSGFAQFVPGTIPGPGDPPPTLQSQTATPTCQGNTPAVNLSYSFINAQKYAIYRNGTVINQAEACTPADASSTYNFSYLDNSGLNTGTTYTYQIVAMDSVNNQYKSPTINATTPNSCP